MKIWEFYNYIKKLFIIKNFYNIKIRLKIDVFYYFTLINQKILKYSELWLCDPIFYTVSKSYKQLFIIHWLLFF